MGLVKSDFLPLPYDALVRHESEALTALKDAYAAGHLTGEDVTREVVEIALTRVGGLGDGVRRELRAALLEMMTADPFCASARDALDGLRP
ncbi:MAG: hypothetical protein ACFCGT_14715 [Sandaracinaceae bacterium]